MVDSIHGSAVVVALVLGVFMGIGLGSIFLALREADPESVARRTQRRSLELAALSIFLLFEPVMLALFLTLTLVAWADGDPIWIRTAGHGLNVMIYVAMLSIGIWLRSRLVDA